MITEIYYFSTEECCDFVNTTTRELIFDFGGCKITSVKELIPGNKLYPYILRIQFPTRTISNECAITVRALHVAYLKLKT